MNCGGTITTNAIINAGRKAKTFQTAWVNVESLEVAESGEKCPG